MLNLFRGLAACFMFTAATLPAFGAGAAPVARDKEWNALIAAAKSRGAAETKLDRSASYVFQNPDGDYLTFTRLLTSDKGRSVCLISKDETATACADWDTGKLTLGKRADAATPWTFFPFDSLDALEAAKPTMVDHLTQGLYQLMKSFSTDGQWDGKSCWGHSRAGYMIHVAKENC